MGGLIITPEILALQAEREALERAEREPKLLPPLSDAMPAKVRAFFEHQEADTPAWRLESREEREARQEAQTRGAWTG